jgi:hypothetical protein
MLQRRTARCNAWQRVATPSSMLQRRTTCCNAVQRNATPAARAESEATGALRCGSAGTVRYRAVLWYSQPSPVPARCERRYAAARRVHRQRQPAVPRRRWRCHLRAARGAVRGATYAPAPLHAAAARGTACTRTVPLVLCRLPTAGWCPQCDGRLSSVRRARRAAAHCRRVLRPTGQAMGHALRPTGQARGCGLLQACTACLSTRPYCEYP